jgi:hypothetical protein
MKCRSEDVFTLFFSPWCWQETEIVVVLDRGIGGAERGMITDVFPERNALQFRAKSWTSAREISFEGVNFSYEGSRAGSALELSEKEWELFVLAEFPNGRSVTFALPKVDTEDTRVA